MAGIATPQHSAIHASHRSKVAERERDGEALVLGSWNPGEGRNVEGIRSGGGSHRGDISAE